MEFVSFDFLNEKRNIFESLFRAQIFHIAYFEWISSKRQWFSIIAVLESNYQSICTFGYSSGPWLVGNAIAYSLPADVEDYGAVCAIEIVWVYKVSLFPKFGWEIAVMV